MAKYIYTLLLSILLLVSGCQTIDQLSIDYMLPAEVSFPATLKRVAVVNNMPEVPDNKLIIDEEPEKKSENEIARLTNYYNGDANLATESLATALANENYFEEVVICDSALRSKDIILREPMLMQEEVNELVQDLNVDFLIALENIQIRSLRKVNYLPEWGAFYGTVDVKVFPSIRVYLPQRKGPMVTVNSNDSIFWEEAGNSEAAVRAHLIKEDDLIKEASEFAGIVPVKHLLPHWKSATRYYFIGGTINMRDAAIYAKEQKWDEAILLWKKDYENKKGKKKMYAAYNTALGYEMQDNIETAMEWALKAQEVAREIDKVNGQVTGGLKSKNVPNYLLTSIYVGELQERKEGISRLNMQMNRFNDEF